MNAFADFHVTFGDNAAAPARARLPENAWRPAGELPGAWSAFLAAGAASTLVQTRDVAPWSVWLVGELGRYDALAAPADPLGAFVLDLRAGRAAPRTLDGHFVLFAWNAATREWHVWTDRFGTMHAYCGVGGRRAALGTFHPAVCAAAAATKLDWEGISGFFGMGFFPEDRTHFEEVRILRPAMHYVFSERGDAKSAARYWDWVHEPERGGSFDEAVSRFGEVLAAVLQEQTARGRVAMPLSGGLDSRTTAAILASRKERQWWFSYGYGEDSVETNIARRIARAREMACETFDVGEYLFDRMDDVLAATEGFNDVTQTRQVSVSAALAAHADSVIAAHWGDVWLDTTDSDGRSEEAVGKVMKGGCGWLFENIAQPRLGRDPEQAVREAVAREMARLPEIPDADFRMKAFKTDAWSFRWTAVGIRAYQLGAFPRLPFYDSRMSDLFCALPTDFVRGRRLQVEWLKRFAPDLARITWQAHDADLYSYRYADTLLLPRRAIKKLWRLITGAQVIERNWEVQFLTPGGRARLSDALLRPEAKLHEFVAPAAVRSLLAAFFERPHKEKRGYTVSMLLTFSAWLERYA